MYKIAIPQGLDQSGQHQDPMIYKASPWSLDESSRLRSWAKATLLNHGVPKDGWERLFVLAGWLITPDVLLKVIRKGGIYADLLLRDLVTVRHVSAENTTAA